MTKIFFDTEFTGLHQKTTLISIGLVSECGKTFYAELTDYDKSQIDDWLRENVIENLTNQLMLKCSFEYCENGNSVRGLSDTKTLKFHLTKWLEQFSCKFDTDKDGNCQYHKECPKVEMWSDCLAYDWVLFNNIFGGAFDIPKNVYYIPFDICTLFKAKGIDPDINREEFCKGLVDTSSWDGGSKKHNSLWDAYVIRECYKLLMK